MGSELVKEKLESKLNHAEENKKKHIEEVKDKISEHTAKIEKAQQALEAAIEAAKEATKAGLDEKMSKNEEKKNEQLREMMNALTEHSDRIKNVRNNMEEKMKPKAQQILEHISKKEEAGDSLPNIAGLTISSVTPTKASTSAADDEATTPKGDNNVSEEDLALVEAVSKTLRDTTGGKSLEIVLSPAVKKPKSRVSPPTSPTNSQETIAKKLQEAEERKHVLKQEKIQKLKLGKIPNVQEMKEKKVAEKSELIKEKLESKLNHAEENKKKHIEEVKDKFSEHTAKNEKKKRALEAAIEAAKEATKA